MEAHDQTPPSDNKHSFNPLGPVLLLLGFALIGALIGSLAGLGIAGAQGYSLQDFVSSFSADSGLAARNTVRGIALANHLLAFLVPALLTAYFFSKKDWIAYLKLGNRPDLNLLFWGSILIIFAFPFAQLTYWLNSQLPLPEILTTMEDSTANLVKGLMVMESPQELIFNLLVIALIPAIAEEMIFRGIVQQSLENWLKNPLKAIWIAAFIFSFIHFQFEGFFPRMVLGAILGYLFYWSGNLWVPITAHFVNNGFQVIAAYWYPEKMESLEPEAMDATIWVAGLLSLGLILGLSWYIRRWKQPEISV